MAKKISISIDEELLAGVEEYRKSNYMTKSGVFTLAVHQFLMAQKTLKLIEGLTQAINKVAEGGNVDEATVNEFKEMEKMLSVMARK